MTINRKNISTSADGADIFTVAGQGSSLTNLGNLTTSGQLANTVRVVDNGVSVINRGSLSTSGDGSSGIVAGDLGGVLVNNVTITNYGTIATSGNFLDNGSVLAFADGIAVVGHDTKVTNYGLITTMGVAAGIETLGSHGVLLNYGTIKSAVIGMVADTLDGTDSGTVMVNYGLIQTSGGEFARGMWTFTNDAMVINRGTVRADGFHDFAITVEGVNGTALNSGQLIAAGEQARGVVLGGENPSFINQGVVTATGIDSIGVRFNGENVLGMDGGTFTNLGKLVAVGLAVRGAPSDDHVVNRGAISGAIDLEAGNDTYVAGKGGSLDGVLTLGDGNDLILFEKGGGKLVVGDFVAGQATNDAIDLSSFGFHSFAEVMSQAHQVESDVLLSLGGKDQILLKGVALGALAEDDFLLGSLATSNHGGPALTLLAPGDHAPHDLFAMV